MAEVIKISILGVVGTLLALQFKSVKPEFGLYLIFALSFFILEMVLSRISAVMDGFAGIKQFLGEGSEYLTILFKVVGVTYICEFAAGICKDAGYSAISNQLEILGKLTVMFFGLPILLGVIEQIKGFL